MRDAERLIFILLCTFLFMDIIENELTRLLEHKPHPLLSLFVTVIWNLILVDILDKIFYGRKK